MFHAKLVMVTWAKNNVSILFTKYYIVCCSHQLSYAIVQIFCNEDIDEDDLLIIMLCGKFGDMVVKVASSQSYWGEKK